MLPFLPLCRRYGITCSPYINRLPQATETILSQPMDAVGEGLLYAEFIVDILFRVNLGIGILKSACFLEVEDGNPFTSAS